MGNFKLMSTCMILFAMLGACSSVKDANDQADTSTPKTVQIKAPNKQNQVDSLSKNQETQIETSNGTITIQATVISATDENSNLLELPETAVEYYDPLESINRPIFTFNHYTYKYALIPLAKGYNYIVPAPARDSLANAFDNIREPLNLINNSLSGEFNEAGSNLGRFLINSTIGLLGLFDPASAWFGIEEKPQSFAQTLMKYNVGSGAYIVLPFLGQSDARGTTSIVSESLVHPTKYIFNSPDDTVVRAVDGFDDFSTQADLYIKLFEQSDDPYLYFRNQYIQSTNRDEMVESEANKEVNITGDFRDE